MAQAPGQPPRRRRATRSTPPPTLGRLRRYRVTKLFDTFNYDFDLDVHGPTLLTGVNGTGKSTILRTIDAISTGRWDALVEVPFSSLELEFDTDRVITVERSSGEMQVSLTGEKSWNFPFNPDFDTDLTYIREVDRELARLRRMEEELYALEVPDREREVVLAERRQLIERRLHLLQSRTRHQPVPSWPSELSERFPVLFITDQRLIIDSPRRSTERERSTRAAADEVARQIAQEIAAAKSAYGSRSQELDHDFPQRVIGTIKNPPKVSDQELREQLEELTRRSESLEAVGLLAKESVSEFEDLDLAIANVMPLIQTYVADSRQKLAVLEPLRVKLQLFSDFLRQHYGHKRIMVDPDRGFTIWAGTRKGRPLAPRKLSSGEQQMMVLAHQILFKATAGTLVLIDEPELSLHVLWQSTFVDDLAEMGKVNNLSFLLATHSPTLIGAREDLKRSLDKMSQA
jgi:ABC-type branched-subunit amino acid transport system ATPase component